MTDSEQSVIQDIAGSPIAGQDELPVDIGRVEVRRARANIEVYYRAEPDEFVDIQALMTDTLYELGRENHRDLGDVIVAVDLTEHVRFADGCSS